MRLQTRRSVSVKGKILRVTSWILVSFIPFQTRDLRDPPIVKTKLRRYPRKSKDSFFFLLLWYICTDVCIPVHFLCVPRRTYTRSRKTHSSIAIIIIIIIIISRVFHTSVSSGLFTGVWVTASLLKSSGSFHCSNQSYHHITYICYFIASYLI